MGSVLLGVTPDPPRISETAFQLYAPQTNMSFRASNSGYRKDFSISIALVICIINMGYCTFLLCGNFKSNKHAVCIVDMSHVKIFSSVVFVARIRTQFRIVYIRLDLKIVGNLYSFLMDISFYIMDTS